MLVSSVDSLKVVASAVTPVVMVSATSILLSGINARYLAISDRVGTISHEYRALGLSPRRRTVIMREAQFFRIRLHLITWAVRMLYLALGCFVVMALVVMLSVWRPSLPVLLFTIFPAGLTCVAAAIVLALAELEQSKHTIGLELADLLEEAETIKAECEFPIGLFRHGMAGRG
jgi:hypothetical protein